MLASAANQLFAQPARLRLDERFVVYEKAIWSGRVVLYECARRF
jgi:hypothetical protein